MSHDDESDNEEDMPELKKRYEQDEDSSDSEDESDGDDEEEDILNLMSDAKLDEEIEEIYDELDAAR
eukprot:2710911-Ditylum_brightwellii.AAC.1